MKEYWNKFWCMQQKWRCWGQSGIWIWEWNLERSRRSKAEVERTCYENEWFQAIKITSKENRPVERPSKRWLYEVREILLKRGRSLVEVERTYENRIAVSNGRLWSVCLMIEETSTKKTGTKVTYLFTDWSWK